MATLLLKIFGYHTFNKTIFPPWLLIYDDMVVYKKKHWFFWADEITFSYNQIAQVILKKGIMFADITIASTGMDHVTIKYCFKGPATLAKKLIDQKIYHTHAKNYSVNKMSTSPMKNFEKSLSRLEELSIRGKISKKTYRKKKAELLKKIR